MNETTNQEEQSSHSDLIQSNNQSNLSPTASDVVIYDNVTLAEFYRKINNFSEEERTIALNLINKINLIIGEDKDVKIENIILLGPVIAELLKIANASTDNRIKALASAQKLITPNNNLFMQNIKVDKSGDVESTEQIVDVTELNIFKDKNVETSVVNNDDNQNTLIVNHEGNIIKPDEIEIPHSPAIERRKRQDREYTKVKVNVTQTFGGQFIGPNTQEEEDIE